MGLDGLIVSLMHSITQEALWFLEFINGMY